jgi:4-hydroxythreonine-4-phosphate dehydrogenase
MSSEAPTPRLMLTPGEPAGIGPDVLIEAAQLPWPAELIAVCDPRVLRHRADQMGRPLTIKDAHLERPARPHEPGRITVLPVAVAQPPQPGTLNPKNAPYVLETLNRAARACMNRQAHAMVTGPVQKSTINQGGLSFSGHTEYLAELCMAQTPVMMLVTQTRAEAGGGALGGMLRVALATTHLPLRDVPPALKPETLTAVLRVLHHDLRARFGLNDPRILVCGLNPHAGEAGHIGWEELEVIGPVLEQLRHEMDVVGPVPADTAFTRQHLEHTDAVLAMYHDQGLPVVKYAGFGDAVNVTLGLPIVRTSVDHGTALELAGSGRADAGSMRAAITLALDLVKREHALESQARTAPM